MHVSSVGIALLQRVPQLPYRKVRQLVQQLQLRHGEFTQAVWADIPRSCDLLTADEKDRLRDVQQQWTVTGFAEYLAERQVHVVSYLDPLYPAQLHEVSGAPLVFFTQGDCSLFQLPLVSVIGSRRPTRYGQVATERIVTDLVGHQLGIVSGFMVGIDYFAHRVAMIMGGKSIAVLGFGCDVFYPRHLRAAAQEFLELGNLMISEYPPDQPPHPGQFPARNRIVAALSLATVVIEAQQKSGSLITAQFALDYNKVVAAVPGPIDSVYSEGTNHLIQEGARLVTSGEDVWTEISGQISPGAVL